MGAFCKENMEKLIPTGNAVFIDTQNDFWFLFIIFPSICDFLTNVQLVMRVFSGLGKSCSYF